MNSTSKEENIISIEFGSNIKVTTPAVFQHDTGQILKFINVPDGAEVQFSNSNSEKTSNRIIQESQVIIPDFLIAEGLEITAYVQYINEDSQTTKKKITIPIIPRARPGDMVPEPEEEAFREQIEGIMQDTYNAAEKAQADVERAKEAATEMEKHAEATQKAAEETQKSAESISEELAGIRYLIIGEAEDATLDKLVELTEKEYYINEENKQDNLYKLLLGN